MGGSSSLTFESLESKTSKGEPVFNQITLKQEASLDIWKMKQSHHGLQSEVWDDIEIRVDKRTRPYQVSYHQLDSKGEEIEYRASCLRCHSTGPRAIRPAGELSIKERIQVASWNLLIKSYGEMKVKENTAIKRNVDLHWLPKDKRSELTIKSCTLCHREGGVRSVLTKEQIGSISFLVEKGAMPPWPHKLSMGEKKELMRFIYEN